MQFLANIISWSLIHLLAATYPGPANQPLPQAVSATTEMTGFVDMHAHPRSDLAYGTELFYGKPYGDIATAMNDCSPYHKGFAMNNMHGNVFRNKVAYQTETMYNSAWVDGYGGYPNFTTWPAWCSVLHQQMWIDWIERAHKGGLNIMVALVAHSHCIADAGETKGPYDDEAVILSAVQGIKDMVASSTFMEVALTPADARRIVASGKLAVVLGLEMENIGNFYNPADPYGAKYNPNPSNADIQTELDKLWGLGIRYIFPIHITNNVFGGTAIFIPAFNVPNKYNTGYEFIPEVVNTKETGIGFDLTHPIITTNPEAQLVAKLAIRLSGGILPAEVNPSIKKNYTYWTSKPGEGHRNSVGLTDKGRFAINYMMKKGFLIDIDHMSDKMANAVLDMAVANDYPVNSGHSHQRGEAGAENERSLKQYEQIRLVGGMVGLAHGATATEFVTTYRSALTIMGNKNVGIGLDAGGFYPLPHVDSNIKVVYDETLTKCTTGNRTWDINIDGFAHYGLFPDFIKSCELAGMTPTEKNVFMSSAEHFTQMWEKCNKRTTAIK